MRVVVVGTSGSGKSTLGQRLATYLDAPFIELDAINWQPNWVDLNSHDVARFRREVGAATAAERWVLAGNYSSVREVVWPRATDLVWLDYAKPLVMWRVVARSMARSLSGDELWPGTGNREDWRRWLDADHPIRWAWDTWAKNRERYGALIDSRETAHMRIHRLRRPREARALTERLAGPESAPLLAGELSRSD